MFVLKSGGYKTHFLSSTSNSLVMIEWRLFEVNPAKSNLFAGLIVSQTQNERVMKSKRGKVLNPSRLKTAVIADIQINLLCTHTPTSPSIRCSPT